MEGVLAFKHFFQGPEQYSIIIFEIYESRAKSYFYLNCRYPLICRSDKSACCMHILASFSRQGGEILIFR